MGSSLKVIPPEACLVSEILSYFSKIETHQWPQSGVVVPTQRLATMILAGLSLKQRALTPPQFFNLESLVDTFVETLIDDGTACPASLLKPVMPGVAQECLLAGLIQSIGFKFLRLGHEHEVMQLFNEITLWDRAVKGWAELQLAVSQNSFLSEGSLDTLSLRCRELEQLFEAYSKTLDQSPCLPHSAHLAARTEWLNLQLKNDAIPTSPDLPQRFIFAGFTSLNPLLTGVLHTLLHNPTWGACCTLLVSQPPPILSSQNPLQKLLEGVAVDAHPGPEPDAEHHRPPRPFKVLVAPDPRAEVLGVLTQAHQAIADGYAPSSIAILVTDDHMYGNYLNMLMPQFSGPFNVALQTSLETTILGRWLRGLVDWLRFGAGPGDLSKALTYLTHPLVERRSQGGTRDQLLVSMDLFSQKSETTPQWSGFVQSLQTSRVPSGWNHLAREVAQRLAPWLQGRDVKPFRMWSQEFRHLLAHDLPLDLNELPENYFKFEQGTAGEDIGIRMASYQAIVDFLATLDSLATFGSPEVSDFPVTRKEFLTVVQRLFRSLKVHSTGDPLYGIQVLSLAEARFIPFELVYILGATEGQFPRALPVDHVLDNTLKTKLGLPGWHLLEAIEDTTFYLLRSRIPRLVLSYPDQSGTAVRSRFIEIALVLGEAQLDRLNPAVVPLLAEPLDEHVLKPGPPLASTNIGFVNAHSTPDIMGTQSAYSLSYLFQCPYRFFLDRCGVSTLSVDIDRNNLREGTALHRVLELFFKEGSPAPGIPALPDTPPEQPWPDFFTNRFQVLAAAVLSEEIKASPLFLHMELKGWSDLGGFLAGLLGWSVQSYNPKGWAYLRHSQHERGFKSTLTLDTLKSHGVNRFVELIGRIDSLFPTPWGQLIIDYKRKGLPAKNQATLGDSPQLLVYALATQPASLNQTMVGYYSLLEGQWLGVSAGSACVDQVSDQKLLGSSKPEANLEDTIAQFKRRLNQSYTDIYGDTSEGAGERLHFRAQPGRCKECTYHGICRREELTDVFQ